MRSNVVGIKCRKRVRSTEKRNVPPGRRKNVDLRSREYLTAAEMKSLVKAAGEFGRHKIRDRTIVLCLYRHALRMSELIDLKWDQVDFKQANMHVRRLKGGTRSVQPILGDELRLLRKVKRQYQSKFVFISERGSPLSKSAIARIVQRAGENAGLELSAHPHMLRHACGFYLADKGVDLRVIQGYMGHRSVQNTVRYVELASGRFSDLWD